MKRRKAREKALQILYRVDMAEGEPEENFAPDSITVEITDADAERYSRFIVTGVMEKRKEIDSAIEECSENWTVDRMAVVDRNILRIAVFELLFNPEVPYRVVMDEAVELAKRYGSEKSGPFINGILDRVYKDTLSRRLVSTR